MTERVVAADLVSEENTQQQNQDRDQVDSVVIGVDMDVDVDIDPNINTHTRMLGIDDLEFSQTQREEDIDDDTASLAF